MLEPILEKWFEQRVEQVEKIYRQTLLRPLFEALKQLPFPDSSEFELVQKALDDLKERSL